MNLYEFLLIAFLVVIFVAFQLLHYRQVDRLLNRLMAANYQEYRYYQDKYKNDLRIAKKLQEEQVKELTKKEKEEPEGGEKVRLEEFEEPWEKE